MLSKFIFGGDVTKNRISRRMWWGTGGILTFLAIELFNFISLQLLFLVITAKHISLTIIFVLSILYVVFLCFMLFFLRKRLNDRGKSYFWVLLYISPFILNIVREVIVLGRINVPGYILQIILLYSSIVILFGFIECGFLKGTTGPNQYGPDPLDTSNQTENVPPVTSTPVTNEVVSQPVSQ